MIFLEEKFLKHGMMKAWDVAKCTAAITAVFVPGAAAYKAIKALGGVKATVQLLAGASKASDWLAIGFKHNAFNKRGV